MGEFAGFCLMLSRTRSSLTFVRWLPVPSSRTSKKTALGIGLWRYAGIGIKPHDLRKMASRRAAVSALARACLVHATGLLSHATFPPCRHRGAMPCPPPALMPHPHHINSYLFCTTLALLSRQHGEKTRSTQGTPPHKEVA